MCKNIVCYNVCEETGQLQFGTKRFKKYHKSTEIDIDLLIYPTLYELKAIVSSNALNTGYSKQMWLSVALSGFHRQMYCILCKSS